MVIAGDGGERGQRGQARSVAAVIRHVHGLSEEKDAVQRNPFHAARDDRAAGEHLRDDCRAHRPVAFRDDVSGRIEPAVVLEPVAHQVDRHPCVGVGRQELLGLARREDSAVAGAGRIDQHDVRNVQRTVGILDVTKRGDRIGLRRLAGFPRAGPSSPRCNQTDDDPDPPLNAKITGRWAASAFASLRR